MARKHEQRTAPSNPSKFSAQVPLSKLLARVPLSKFSKQVLGTNYLSKFSQQVSLNKFQLASCLSKLSARSACRNTLQLPSATHICNLLAPLAGATCRDWETQGDKWENLIADAGRQAGDKTDGVIRPQTLGDTERQAGDTTRSQRHSIWHLTAETGRHRETSGKHDPGAGVTASGI